MDHYGPPADWSAIARLKETVTEIPVLGNGDVWEARDALRMLRSTGCDGVVVGRGCLGRPWLFGHLASVFAGEEPAPPPTVGEMIPTMLDHVEALVGWLGPVVGVRDFRKHTAWYVKGYPVGAEMRRQLSQVSSVDQLAHLLSLIDPAIALPDDARRMPRGHTSGPRPVALPDGWLEAPDVIPPVNAKAEALVSGG
jgi:tRNA-dihydrouridine synthase